MARTYENGDGEGGETVQFEIHEVYYTDGVPDRYTTEAISLTSEADETNSDPLDGLKWTMEKIEEAFTKPILWYDENKFPNEYNIMKDER